MIGVREFDRRRAVSANLARRIRVTGIVLGSVFALVLVVLAGVIISSALTARSNLEAVFPMVGALQQSVVRGEPGAR